ncbi:hypothetical protein [Polaromonas sp. CG_23.6]|uniref:hypothetical protein n=1 Tax=Polaromonas sp. CG_23.6 TaxID=2760709 RepID=UPI00247543FD|nr:hypothetical protein [Polaromonas sp. CG_23.6]MDH6186782.1 hypothetical protein [Polaromonas sp. CG_23.6]
MPKSQPNGQRGESMRTRWLQVCRARGTPAPDPARVVPFLSGLDEQAHEALAQALVLCLKGQEKRRELEVLAWAAGCTRPALLAQLQAQGIVCTGHDLFSVGLDLMASGWDMSARLAQLAQHPDDVTSLRQALELQASANSTALEAQTLPTMDDAAATLDPDQETAPDWDQGADTPPEPSELSGPFIGTRHARMDEPAPTRAPERLQVKLFGSQAAHTLETVPHRRSSSFMGVQVVTIESARALGKDGSDGSGGYDWGRKLTVQLTPEEMPGAMAVLMNLSASVRFGQHGAARDKFVELRRQDGGMVLVTGQGSAVYAVPVKTGQLYYLLGLFAQAMARGLPGGSVAEVLALVKASQ